MSNQETVPINVWLCGRSYRIRVAPGTEEIVTRAVKAADKKINELKIHYAGKDEQDFLAMTLLMYAAEATNSNWMDPGAKLGIEEMKELIDNTLNADEV